MKQFIAFFICLFYILPIEAQDQIHKGGSYDGYTSVTYYKYASALKNTTSFPLEIHANKIYNNEQTPYLVKVYNVLGCLIESFDLAGKSQYILVNQPEHYLILQIENNQQTQTKLMMY